MRSLFGSEPDHAKSSHSIPPPSHCTERGRAQNSGVCRLCAFNADQARKRAALIALVDEEKREFSAPTERRLREKQAQDLRIQQEGTIKRLSDELVDEFENQRIKRVIEERRQQREWKKVRGAVRNADMRTATRQRLHNGMKESNREALKEDYRNKPERMASMDMQQTWI